MKINDLKPTMVRPLVAISLEMAHLDLIKDNPIQPDRRHAERAIGVLKDSVVRSGIIVPPLISDTNVILDGHRRIYVARDLGIEILQCGVVRVEDVTAAFLQLNSGVKAIKGNAQLTMWAKSGKLGRKMILEQLPSNAQKQIESFVDIFGEKRATEIGLEGTQAPFIATRIESVLSAIIHSGLDYHSKRTVGEWVMKHHLQDWISDKKINLGRKSSVLRILRAIEKDQHPDRTYTTKAFRELKRA